MLEIKWFTLKLYKIPLIDKQADRVIDIYDAVRNEIIDGDILAVQRLADLKDSVRLRLEELHEFYTQHALDPRMQYLFGTIMKLSRLVETQEFRIVDDELPKSNFNKQMVFEQEAVVLAKPTRQKQISGHKQLIGGSDSSKKPRDEPFSNQTPKMSSNRKMASNRATQLPPKTSELAPRAILKEPTTPFRQSKPILLMETQKEMDRSLNKSQNKSKSGITPRKLNIVKQSKREQVNQSSSALKPGLISNRVAPNSLRPDKTPPSQRMGSKTINDSAREIKTPGKVNTSKKQEMAPAVKVVQQVSEAQRRLIQQNEQRKEAMARDGAVKKSYRDLSELVFTIKMTKEEYREFMLLKARNNHT